MFRLKATRGLFWDGPRNFETRSEDEDYIYAGNVPLQSVAPHLRKDFGPTTSNLMCTRTTRTTDLLWNRVSNLQPSGPEVKTLPIGHGSRSRFGAASQLRYSSYPTFNPLAVILFLGSVLGTERLTQSSHINVTTCQKPE
ncbi:hypothetical protein AVEN_95440-1 [Araneus ventricosus]|uniref:Uncharacterized protein n=1 Tax=Araneus ventricosus TaxID=182803 RepID=A0A4Y2CIJ1_ARAVE|nr:hypothetical protein AVEN_95440-1 [Araneus ventricosus]